MGRAIDPERQRVGNLRRRAAMLERHAAALDPASGKSRLAVGAGRLGGQRTVERHGSSSAWGLRLALWRWHGIAIKRGDADAVAGEATAAQTEVRDGGAQPSR